MKCPLCKSEFTENKGFYMLGQTFCSPQCANKYRREVFLKRIGNDEQTIELLKRMENGCYEV